MENKDLISRKALIDWFMPYIHSGIETISAETVIEDIRAVPAVEAAPVVHGKWEWHGPCRDNKGTYWATCSACKTRQRLGDYETYCPSCGAKMRED